MGNAMRRNQHKDNDSDDTEYDADAVALSLPVASVATGSDKAEQPPAYTAQPPPPSPPPPAAPVLVQGPISKMISLILISNMDRTVDKYEVKYEPSTYDPNMIKLLIGSMPHPKASIYYRMGTAGASPSVTVHNVTLRDLQLWHDLSMFLQPDREGENNSLPSLTMYDTQSLCETWNCILKTRASWSTISRLVTLINKYERRDDGCAVKCYAFSIDDGKGFAIKDSRADAMLEFIDAKLAIDP